MEPALASGSLGPEAGAPQHNKETKVEDWLKFSFKVWLAYLTAQFVIILVGVGLLLIVLAIAAAIEVIVW